MADITVYTARKIHTMEPSQPDGTAIAVRDGTILEVGSLESLKPWLDRYSHHVDTSFADKIILPGFIDPHLHPSMASVILPMQFITALEWKLPWGTSPAIGSRAAYLESLASFASTPDDRPFFTWGYHRDWHGEITRNDIDAICPDRPVVIWHRSFHEVIMNSAALARFELETDAISNHPQIDLETGKFFETGLRLAIAALNPILMSPEHFGLGMARLKQVAHFGGHTLVGDMGIGIFNFDVEWQAACASLDNADTPFRVHYTPNILALTPSGDFEETRAYIDTLPSLNTDRLFFSDHVKLFTDGAFFSQLMMVGPPGYLDGHEGEWLMVPENFEAAARLFWHAGYKIHVHCTGDLGLELALDVLERLQFEKPRVNHRFTIEHLGLSTPDQIRRMKDLGALASVNIYYLHELSDIYAREAIGTARAHTMARVGTLSRFSIPFALHSDYTMAPAQPLNSAWVAVNRQNVTGAVVGPEERISIDQALRAITIDAAYVLGLEHEIGSLQPGKRADFTVLEEDPYDVPPTHLRDIEIWGTVFGGVPAPLDKN